MAEATVTENLVNDLLSRVQKLEKESKVLNDIQKYLGTLDGIVFSMTVALDVISKVLVDKGLVGKEELTQIMSSEKERITKEIQTHIDPEAKPEV